MEITIKISKKDAEHLKQHTFYDGCWTEEKVMLKVQKEINKSLNKH